MKKLVSLLFVVYLILGFAVVIQAEKPEQDELWGIIPGGCSLAVEVTPTTIVIDDLNRLEVELEANWNPVKPSEIEDSKYGGVAKFGVFDVKIGDAEPLHVTVDIGLTKDDPDFSDNERDKLLVYQCDADASCTATLLKVKDAITEQIARDNAVEVGDVTYMSAASATFLGVFVKTGKDKRQNYNLTEVCDLYQITLAEARITD